MDFKLLSKRSRHFSEFEWRSILNFLREPCLKGSLRSWLCFKGKTKGVTTINLPRVSNRFMFSKQQVSFLDPQFRATTLSIFLVLPDFPFSLRYMRWGGGRCGVLLSGGAGLFGGQNERVFGARVGRFSRSFWPVDLY